MGWSSEPVIQDALTAQAWDGTLPQVPGDFFYEGEFEYGAKNGGGLHRTFEHNVVLRADGSAKVTTHVTIDNTLPPNYGFGHDLNIDSLSFVTVYGPNGATLGAGFGSHRRAAAGDGGPPRRGVVRGGQPEVVDVVHGGVGRAEVAQPGSRRRDGLPARLHGPTGARRGRFAPTCHASAPLEVGQIGTPLESRCLTAM